MSAIEYTILSIFEYCMMLFIVKALLNRDRIQIIRTVIYITIAITLIYMNNLFVYQQNVAHVISILIYLLWMRYYWSIKSLNKMIMIFATMSIIGFAIQMVTMAIISAIDSGFELSFYYGVISQSVALVLTIILTMITPIRALNVYIEDNNMVFKAITVNIYLVYFFISMQWFGGNDAIFHSQIAAIVIVMLTLAINTVFLREGLLNQANLKQLDAFKRYMPMVESLMQEIREKQHDYNNHIQSLVAISENNKILETSVINNYIHDLKRDEMLPTMARLNNHLLSALLYSKYKEASALGIDMTIVIGLNNHISHYKDFELIELYGILLDNAIEATVDYDEKRIEIELSEDNQKKRLIVKNTAPYVSNETINKFFKRGYSSKGKENRGIGLSKLKKMLRKHEGTITASYDTFEHKMIFEIVYN